MRNDFRNFKTQTALTASAQISLDLILVKAVELATLHQWFEDVSLYE